MITTKQSAWIWKPSTLSAWVVCFMGMSISDRATRAHPDNECTTVNANEDTPATTIGIAPKGGRDAAGAPSGVTIIESSAIR